MNASPIAALVRAWVDLYTRGLSEPARAARRDEVDDDLWCQHEEAAAIGRRTASVNAEMFIRLLFGMPADVSWRMSKGAEGGPVLHREPSTGDRMLGAMAVLGAVGWGIALTGYVVWGGEGAWRTAGALMFITQLVGALGIAGAAIGIALSHDRLVGGMAGALGGVAGLFATMGAYLLYLLVPLCTGVMAWDLGRARVLSRPLAITHSVSGILTLPLLIALVAGVDVGLIGLEFLALMVPYLVSWVGIGVWLIRGVPASHDTNAHPYRLF